MHKLVIRLVKPDFNLIVALNLPILVILPQLPDDLSREAPLFGANSNKDILNFLDISFKKEQLPTLLLITRDDLIEYPTLNPAILLIKVKRPT